MANYSNLKAAIEAAIKTNGNQEITGQVLQDVLTSIVSVIGANYTFAGVATPATNPGTPDQNVVYLAMKGGTYTNFNGTVLPAGISLLMWNGVWTSNTVMYGDGGAFDISVYKSTGGTLAKFADLAAALDGGNNIPASARKGGMSVKFVQSSDNKYVQYRLRSNAFTTDVTKWINVDEEVETVNSEIGRTILANFELGGFNWNTGAKDSFTDRIRNINPITCNIGDCFAVKDHDYTFCLRWEKEDGTFGNTGAWIAGPYTITEKGDYYICVQNKNSSTVTVNELFEKLFISQGINNGVLQNNLSDVSNEQGITVVHSYIAPNTTYLEQNIFNNAVSTKNLRITCKTDAQLSLNNMRAALTFEDSTTFADNFKVNGIKDFTYSSDKKITNVRVFADHRSCESAGSVELIIFSDDAIEKNLTFKSIMDDVSVIKADFAMIEQLGYQEVLSTAIASHSYMEKALRFYYKEGTTMKFSLISKATKKCTIKALYHGGEKILAQNYTGDEFVYKVDRQDIYGWKVHNDGEDALLLIISERIDANGSCVYNSAYIDMFNKSYKMANFNISKAEIHPTNVFVDGDVPALPRNRIPSALITNNGILLVACERRKNDNDDSCMEIPIKRYASDGSYIDEVIAMPYSETYGHPSQCALVVDRTGANGQAGRIWIVSYYVTTDDKHWLNANLNEVNCICRYSDDDGATWSEMFSLKSLYHNDFITAGSAPSIGIQMSDDGTLVIPCEYIISVRGNRTIFCGLLIKRPNEDWYFSEPSPTFGDECTVVENDEGFVVVNSRYGTGRNKARKIFKYVIKTDTWLNDISDSTFSEPYCTEGCLSSIVISNKKYYLFSYPDSDSYGNIRSHITLWGSTDLVHWIRLYDVNPDNSLGYSIVTNYNGKLVVVYEYDYGSIAFKDLSSLLQYIDQAMTFDYNQDADSRIASLIRLLN